MCWKHCENLRYAKGIDIFKYPPMIVIQIWLNGAMRVRHGIPIKSLTVTKVQGRGEMQKRLIYKNIGPLLSSAEIDRTWRKGWSRAHPRLPLGCVMGTKARCAASYRFIDGGQPQNFTWDMQSSGPLVPGAVRQKDLAALFKCYRCYMWLLQVSEEVTQKRDVGCTGSFSTDSQKT